MTNAVDIIVLDGPHAGTMLCQPKPVPATITHENVTYTTDTYDRRHIAYQEIDALDDAEYWFEEKNLLPSWDLPA